MAKLTLNDIEAGYLTHTAYNANNALIETALENTLSRDGTTPNQMGSNIDMNSHRILNLSEPINSNEAARLADVQAAITGLPTANLIPFTPYANIASDTVQGAIQEVMDDVGAGAGSSLIGFLQQGAGAVATTVENRLRQTTYVTDYGAVGDGVADDTLAIQAAVDAIIAAGGGNLYFPSGIYLVTDQITINGSFCFLTGDGPLATQIKFEPTAAKVCFLFDEGDAVLYHVGISGMGFYSTDVTFTKTAIKTVDCSGYFIENVHTHSPHWHGANSEFLSINGREHGWIRNIYAFADLPLVVSGIPAPHVAGGIGIDHHNFHNLYLVTPVATNPVIRFSTGLIATQVSFTGTQSWIGGKNGLEWIDTTSVASSNGLSIHNVRLEQAVDATGYAIRIEHNQALQGLVISGGQCGDRNGLYLRKVLKPHLSSFWYTNPVKEAMNADTTVDDISADSCFWQAGSTATITGHDLVFATPKNPNTGALAPTFRYCLTSNAAQMELGRTFSGTATRVNFTEVLGGGTITSTYRYTLLGKMCHFSVRIVCAGGATIASTAGLSHITGLPTAAFTSTCTAANSSTLVGIGVGYVLTAVILTPSWVASANHSYIISGVYEVA